jgi:hypothetical protein
MKITASVENDKENDDTSLGFSDERVREIRVA